MKIVALAGGVGGAKLVDGLAQCLPHSDMSVIVNTGDDFNHFGLHICPDLDTVCYTLAGIASVDHGWGIQDETWQVRNQLGVIDAPNWFQMGDKDLAFHLERTRLLSEGRKLSEVTQILCHRLGVDIEVYPMSDDIISTNVLTLENGKLPFQEYFVRLKYQPQVTGFEFVGARKAKPVEKAMQKIDECDLVIICPSNPWVSISPILAIKSVTAALRKKVILCVSPIVGGKALKGPAAKIFSELGITPSSLAVAKFYGKLIDGIVIDRQDINLKEQIEHCGIMPFITDIIMADRKKRITVARNILSAGADLLKRC